MIRITQLRLPCGHTPEALETKIKKQLRLRQKPLSITIVRHSVDARKKPRLYDIYTVDVETGLRPGEESALVRRLRDSNVSLAPKDPYAFPEPGSQKLSHRPVVIGAGPAGLFCALFLAKHGYRPLVIERGRRMEERTADVARFWKEGVLDPASNVQFGEGGAGTFSDGKLNTQINDRTGRSGQVLRIFAETGAPASILYESRPHIGTDRLREVIPNIRRQIEAAGGEVRFETQCTGFIFEAHDHVPGRRLAGIRVRSQSGSGEEITIAADVAVLAIGHSARDTMMEIWREKIPMEQKQFAVGFRVAHPQALIDESQYGFSDPAGMEEMGLSASPYKLTARASSGRGVYSFCMCPGGYIVNASSEKGHLCVNGMSDEKRDSGYANSAIVITVGQKEFGSSHVLAGMEFQRRLEEKAYDMGQGRIPVQGYPDFRRSYKAGINGPYQEETGKDTGATDAEAADAEAIKEGIAGSGENPDAFNCGLKGGFRKAPLHTLLPSDLTCDFIEGMEAFGRKIEGFNGPQALVAGIESRTSSPVRIPRGETMESTGAAGLYPCGEGAGYAGGIMSAAMDGMRIAEAIARRYMPLNNIGS